MSKHQKFEMRVINRDDITLADYNPRRISADAKRRLKATMKEVGLLQPLIWNQRTGVLVSGHQRLVILDEMEHYVPGIKTYTLEVAVVDLDERQERRMNVFLNNTSSMGEFDLDALNDMRVAFDFDADALGFSIEDMEVLFPADAPAALADTAEAARAKNTLDKIKEERAEAKGALDDEQSIAYYFTVVCATAEEKERLLESLGVPGYEEYVRAQFIADRIAAHSST